MGIKSLLFVAAFSFSFASFVSTSSLIPVCKFQKLAGLPCTTCDFLTFGQEQDPHGLISYFCPINVKNGKVVNEYCCYNLLRQPFCCDASTHAFNVFLWIVAVIITLYAALKILRCLFGQ